MRRPPFYISNIHNVRIMTAVNRVRSLPSYSNRLENTGRMENVPVRKDIIATVTINLLQDPFFPK